MKNVRYVLIIMIFVLLCSFSVYSEDSSCVVNQQHIAYFPESIISIDEEAFQGSLFDVIVFSENLISIDEKAFSNTKKLRSVYLPRSVEYISKTAFDNNKHVTFFGEKDSYAEKWARDNNFNFVADFAWLSGTTVPQLHLIYGSSGENNYCWIRVYILALILAVYTCYEIRDRRQKYRPELYPIDYRFP